MLKGLIDADYSFTDKPEVQDFFTRLTSHYKNWNYSAADSSDARRFAEEIQSLADQHRAT